MGSDFGMNSTIARRHKPREIERDVGERHVVADREMVDEGQREREVGRAPKVERHPLFVRPADCGARAGEVRDEWQNPLEPLAPDLAIEQVHADRIPVERDDGSRRAARRSC